LRIRIRIQDSQNGVQKGKEIGDFKFKGAFTTLLKASWFLLEPMIPQSVFFKPLETGKK